MCPVEATPESVASHRDLTATRTDRAGPPRVSSALPTGSVRAGVQAARLHLLDLPLYTWLSSSSRLQLPLASGLRTPDLNP